MVGMAMAWAFVRGLDAADFRHESCYFDGRLLEEESAMSKKMVERINLAIKDCLQRCYENSMPLGALGEFMDGLRADPTWNEAEIEQVERGVLQMLAALSGRSDEVQSNVQSEMDL
jgi:hypothetical protein